MNFYAIKSIYKYEMSRTYRTISQSLLAPIISTILYFVVFGSAIGSKIENIEGIEYGVFIVPGLVMLSVLMQSVTNAAFAIYFPKFIGTINELLSAPLSTLDIIIGYIGAATTKSFCIGIIILLTAHMIVPINIIHPIYMILFLFLTCFSFSSFGFIIGLWAKNFEQLNLVPMLIITPLVFLGGSFYSISMLPIFWQKISMINPVVYLISGFKWTFFNFSDFSFIISLSAIISFALLCNFIIFLMFKTGYKIRT
ncbi:MAG: Inner membrane transport permease YadH [Alphaproteobacteria bacterium MarineAlpha9_Bin3]|nr:MAG: Inner membrane transport permease YadH [Alphaproteobacteria bacterium MarineAlpha9_Bin3]|tara:strand:+ start:1001 stop:1762 length:762 start_codon:yes stop_codon:yes gene_type:complete